ncbi:MAG: hypothetical protein H7289_15670, partial [Mucilaginibacter sp.]|nr:hypothetical protein [Mucilaginibacter sp.]
KVTHEGVYKVDVKVMNGTASINDSFETTGVYLLFNKADLGLANKIKLKFNETLANEASYRFDPITNDADFKVLTDEVNKIVK